MSQLSAGLLMYRTEEAGFEVLLVHMGGPFWQRKDEGAWTIPRGEVAEGEGLLEAGIREFREETGFDSSGPYLPLGEVRNKSGKCVHAWGFRGTCDPTALRSNTFEMEWPPKSGQRKAFPEVDRAAFFGLAEAKRKILRVEQEFLVRLAAHLSGVLGNTEGPEV